jgi:hypothetical protein
LLVYGRTTRMRSGTPSRRRDRLQRENQGYVVRALGSVDRSAPDVKQCQPELKHLRTLFGEQFGVRRDQNLIAAHTRSTPGGALPKKRPRYFDRGLVRTLSSDGGVQRANVSSWRILELSAVMAITSMLGARLPATIRVLVIGITARLSSRALNAHTRKRWRGPCRQF